MRNDGASSDVVYVLPVTTYQAYNKWGGRSLYTFQSSGDNTVSGTPRAVKVSFDRPYNQSLDGLNNWFTVCDIQNLAWLEQQGYDVTYQTSIDIHTGSNIGNHSAFVSPSHDEYWSTEMRNAVTNARDNGVGLFFLGANAVYWRIRFESNPNSGVPNRIQVCYKTTESGAADPVTPTTTWRDPAGANQPENGLLGQMYIGDNGSIFFPLVVSAAQGRLGDHRSAPAGLPTTTSPGATSRVTTAPAPTIAPAPTVTPPRITLPDPSDAPRPITVRMSCQSASVCSLPSAAARGRLSLMNMTPWPTNASSSITTPSQMNVWLCTLQRAPMTAPRWISTKVPIRVSSPMRQP